MKILRMKLVRPNDVNFAYVLRVIANDIENGKTYSEYWDWEIIDNGN